ncbi:ABC transporter permease [Ancylobacter pratisalsi]|uniref:ABC transporter permease n=1 Tax=Ancylobacter pratisalsi TaxID=1745854 RepID=A0A6P1YPQ6_9HYPH|nr:ABC transporter permease [Ancylobacter pratisalsi]QIB34133.1 ABC transporter permease [Ancylobacter pratisalsi]
MARKRSVIDLCLTPKAEVPGPVRYVVSTLVWLLVIAVWSGLTYGGVMADIFLPSPSAVLGAFFRLTEDGTLSQHIWASLQVVITGFVISSILAVPLGLLMGTFRVVQAGLEPLVNFIRYLPVTSFVPLFILWIGIGIEQRITVIFFGTFFQQLIMVADVSRGVSKDLLNASYTLGATRRDAVLHVLTPAALPGIMDTLRITMGWAWTYLVVAELVAASSGLGYISMKAMRGFQVDVIFLAIAVIGLLGLITDLIFRLVSKRLVPWAS